MITTPQSSGQDDKAVWQNDKNFVFFFYSVFHGGPLKSLEAREIYFELQCFIEFFFHHFSIDFTLRRLDFLRRDALLFKFSSFLRFIYLFICSFCDPQK